MAATASILVATTALRWTGLGKKTRGEGGGQGCARSLERGKGGAIEKLDEGGVGGLLRWGGVGENQWGLVQCARAGGSADDSGQRWPPMTWARSGRRVSRGRGGSGWVGPA
jgi:hypothetical protein